MFDVKYYEDKNGKSEVRDYIEDLERKSKTDKSARTLYKKFIYYLGLLKSEGTRTGEPAVKHIDGDIWELRPIDKRIFFFYWKDNKFVFLHHFTKKTNKTPPHEIIQAKNKLKDWVERNK